MAALDTKLEIVDALMCLCERMRLAKISVSDIVAESGKNRKTFYYHFVDKNHLIAWVFRYDMGMQLEKVVPPEHLLYARTGDEHLDAFPYYTLIKDGVRTIDGSPFVHALAQTLQKRRSFYAQALMLDDARGLKEYLRRLYTPALHSDVELILSNRFLAERQVRFLADFSLGALLDYFCTHLNERGEFAPMDDFGPFANIVHTSISDAITRHQQGRSL